MNEVTRILKAAEEGDPTAAEQLLPLVYEELRKLAAAKLSKEQPGQTLQATALVHEAYIRLIGNDQGCVWDSQTHFFGAAAEAMRRILIEQARRKSRTKRGGQWQRQEFDEDAIVRGNATDTEELLAIHEALDDLETHSERKAKLVKLRYFLGCTVEESAEILKVSTATAQDDWRYAKAWLRRRIGAP